MNRINSAAVQRPPLPPPAPAARTRCAPEASALMARVWIVLFILAQFNYAESLRRAPGLPADMGEFHGGGGKPLQAAGEGLTGRRFPALARNFITGGGKEKRKTCSTLYRVTQAFKLVSAHLPTAFFFFMPKLLVNFLQ